MNVSLTPKLEAFVRRKVAQGLYGSASEVVREALQRQMEGARFHLLDLAAVQHACTEALGRPAEVLTRGTLDPEVLAALERDAVRVF